MGRRFALALAAALSAGCSLDVSGLSAGAGGASVSAGGQGSVVSSSGSVTSSGTTAPCTGAEICNDGIDNDCNMATDCEDAACKAGFVCIPAIPSGWRAVAFSAQGRPACPGGDATAVDVVSAPAAPATCACTCGAPLEAASCIEGTIVIEPTGGGQCTGATPINLDPNGSSCGKLDLFTGANSKVKISPLPATQGKCSGNVTKTALPPVEGRSCVSAVGAGCADGGACVTSLSAPFASCIEHDGAEACPTAFPNGHSVGTSFNDTRGCSTCSCETSATCPSPKLTFFTSDNCSFGSFDLPMTGACESLNDGLGDHYNSFRYTSTPVNGACGKTMDTALTGSLELMGARTVCCQ